MICSDCGKETTILAAGRCLACNDKSQMADYPTIDASEGGAKLLAFLEKLSNDKSNGVIILPSGRRMVVLPRD